MNPPSRGRVVATCILLVGGAAGWTAAFAGCGGRIANEGTDAGEPVDSGITFPADSRPTPVFDAPRPLDAPVADTRPPPDPTTCANDLPADFACTVPIVPPGSTLCSEENLQDFYKSCFTGDGTECSAWIKKNPECYKCFNKFISTSGFLQYGYCMQALVPTSPCGKLEKCNTDCFESVCQDCDYTLGSGRSPSTSEYMDCVKDAQFAGSSSKPKGRCYDVATKPLKASDCTTAEPFVECLDVIQFLRGACRDGGDWTNMKSATPKSTDDGGTGG